MKKVFSRVTLALTVVSGLSACTEVPTLYASGDYMQTGDYGTYQEYKQGQAQPAQEDHSESGDSEASGSKNDLGVNINDFDAPAINLGDDSEVISTSCGKALALNLGNNSQVLADGSQCN